MRAILLLVLLVIGTQARVFSNEADYMLMFKEWIREFNKIYAHEEFFGKFARFMDNVDKVYTHNAQGLSWTMSLNEFADLSTQEFKATYIGAKMQIPQVLTSNGVNEHANVIPSNDVDWVSAGAVTPVKNQGQCGSCYSFSTTGTLEGAVKLKSGTLPSLSEQQIVDCSQSYGDSGCNGGLMNNALNYVIARGGICSESSYPYLAYVSTCRQTSCTNVANTNVRGYTFVTSKTEVELKSAVNVKPVAVAIEADQDGFQMYHSGVFSGTCGTSLDHAVLCVGYGTDSGSGLAFWKVKNSWGTSWGEGGYIRMIRRDSSGPGQCGIALFALYPTY